MGTELSIMMRADTKAISSKVLKKVLVSYSTKQVIATKDSSGRTNKKAKEFCTMQTEVVTKVVGRMASVMERVECFA